MKNASTNIVKTLITTSIYIAFSFFLFYSSAHAQSIASSEDPTPLQYLKISPIISDIILIPGKITKIPLSVQNLSDQPVGIHADVSLLDEEDASYAKQVQSPLLNWTTLSSKDLVIEPAEVKTIDVTIKTPATAKTSGYYETIFLTPFISQQRVPDKPVVLSRIGALVFATVGKLNYNDLKSKVSISDFHPLNRIFKNTKAQLDFSVKNSYFTHFTAKPFLTISPLFGKSDQVLIEEKRVLPGKTRTWHIIQDLKAWNFYKSHLTVSIGNGEQILKDTWFVILPLPLKEILIFALLIGLIWFVVFKKARIKKALKIIMGK